MAHITATLLPDVEARPDVADAAAALKRLRILTEKRDFGRPPPMLASLYELFTGKAFGRSPGATITFQSADAPNPTSEPLLDLLWLRIDTRYGDLASSTGKRIALRARLDLIPRPFMDALSKGRAMLVLDWSHEGRPTFWRSHIKDIVANYGIPASAVVVLTQNTAPPEPAGTDDLHIVNAHAFIPVFWRLIFGMPVRRGESPYTFGFAALGDGERTHRYVCANFEATATRALLAARLLDRAEPGHLSFRKDQYRRSMPGSAAFRAEINQVSLQRDKRANHLAVEGFVGANRNYTIDLPSGTHPHQASYFLPADAMRVSELDIVTEHEMGMPNQKRFTEKTLKAVIAGLPFVVFGNQGTIALLEESGLDVLPDFIDHSYDTEPEPASRFDAAWRAVEDWFDREPGFSPAELKRLADAAAHNRSVFETALFHRWVLDPISRLAALHPTGALTAEAAAA